MRMGTWEAWYPVGLVWRSANAVFFVINSTKTTNIRQCLFFEWLIKNLKRLSYLCILCVQRSCFNSCQTLFLPVNSVTRIYLYALVFVHSTLNHFGHMWVFMYSSLGTQNMNFCYMPIHGRSCSYLAVMPKPQSNAVFIWLGYNAQWSYLINNCLI